MNARGWFASKDTAAAALAALARHVDLTRFEDVRTDVEGMSIYFKSARAPAREAPCIVLVHGLGLSCRYMLPTAQALLGDYHLLVPDLPGFGDSTKPDRVLTIDELAIGYERRPVLDPAIAAAAILQGPTTPPNERSIFWQFIRWRQNLGYDPPDMKVISRDDYLKSGRRRVGMTFLHGLRDAMEKRLSRIGQPVLVVRGELDPICRREWARNIAERLPRGSYVEIHGVAHTMVFTAPAQLAEVSRKFLDGGALDESGRRAGV